MPTSAPTGRSVTRVLLVSASLLAAACGGGPAFDGHTFRGRGVAFQIGPQGSGWTRLESNEPLLAFRDEALRSTILVNGRCGKDGDDVPLTALTAHLFLQFTERDIQTEETIPFDGREARRTVLSAKLDGVPMRFEAFVLKKDGCVYDFVLMSEPGTFDGARPSFERFVTGFHAVPT